MASSPQREHTGTSLLHFAPKCPYCWQLKHLQGRGMYGLALCFSSVIMVIVLGGLGVLKVRKGVAVGSGCGGFGILVMRQHAMTP